MDKNFTKMLIKDSADAIKSVMKSSAMQYRNANLDDASEFVARQLTYNRAMVFSVEKSPLEAFNIFNVSTDIPAGAKSAVRTVYTDAGLAKIVANPADDLPTTDLYANEVMVQVRTIATAYTYSLEELENAAFANVNLPMKKALAAKDAIDRKINELAFFGDKDYSIVGFIDNPNVNTYTVKKDGTGSSTKFSAKTPDKILRDVNEIVNSVRNNTKGIVTPDKVLFSPEVYDIVNTTPYSAVEPGTILTHLKSMNPQIKDWIPVYAFAGKGMIIAGAFESPLYAHLEIPQTYVQVAPQPTNLSIKIPVYATTAGVTVERPFAFSKATGL